MPEKNKKFSYPKSERLKKNKIILDVVRKGKAIKAFPFYVRWKVYEQGFFDSPLKITFTVSKKKFKRAVDRNRIKRLMREAYRLNKEILLSSLDTKRKNIAVIVSYVDTQKTDFFSVNSAIVKIFKRMADEISGKS